MSKHAGVGWGYSRIGNKMVERGGWVGGWGLQLAIGRRSYSHSAATVSKSLFVSPPHHRPGHLCLFDDNVDKS